jgi:predicted regulator of Ras-like GTPase activity (Roadblock/LC7/MglB family)
VTVASFGEALQQVASRVPEAEVLMVIGTDGIPIDRLAVRPGPDIEAVAAEHTTLLRASLSTAGDTGLGELRELAVVTDRMTTLLVSITPDYFLFASLSPGAVLGRARFALRMAGLSLREEFE